MKTPAYVRGSFFFIQAAQPLPSGHFPSMNNYRIDIK
jgi:hypothetical protein